MIPIKIYNGRRLAKSHSDSIYEYFLIYKNGALLPLIEKWIKSKIGKNYNFKKILSASPSELETIIEIYDRKSKSKFPSYINALKKVYTNFRSVQKSPLTTKKNRSYNGYLFAENLGVTVCPYCNRNFIFNIPQSNYTTCQLDHFYNQSDYPFLAISFYNLIPVCSTCNHIKSSIKGNYYNLYSNRLKESELLKFSVKILGVNYLDDLKDIEIEFTSHQDFKDNFSVLKIAEIYGKHCDLAQDIIKKHYLYNPDYIDELFGQFQGKLFKNKEQLLNLILSNYLQEENLSKRPFSKITKDIWEQLAGLDKYIVGGRML